MKPAADISVVIPAYNARAFVAEALDSIRDQSTHPKDVFVVDDGSKDDTAEVVRGWIAANPTSFPVLLLQQKNGGISVARNAAIRQSSAAWVALLDADDIWLPNHLQALLEALAASPGSVAAYGAGKLFRGKDVQDLPYDDFWDNPSKVFGQPLPGSEALLIDRRALPRLLRGNFIKPSSLLLSRAALQQWGLFDEKQGNAEDRELLARLLIHGSFVYWPQPITLYRWHDDNASQGKNAKRNLEFGLRAVKSIAQRFAAELSRDERSTIAVILRDTAAQYADVCTLRGLATLVQGWRFLRGQFGMRFALTALTPRRIAKGIWSSIRPAP